MRDGKLDQKFLLQGDDDSPNNYLLNVGLTGSGGWGTPRHRHNFDQIRYVLKGKYPASPHKIMGEGSVAYFPESVHYGPQDRPEGLEMMVIQFGGASGDGFLSTPKREAANEALKAKGEFKNGIFTWFDEKGQKHNMDGSAACFEEATGKKLVFHPPRYDDIMMMDPEAYAWVGTGTEGVSSKVLGVFTERNTRIGFLKIDAGATYNTGTRSQIEVLFMSKGSITVDGRTYGEKTAIELLPSDAPVDIKANEESLFFTVTLPQF
ncbi:cupin domain-containing protein [Aureimonas sp. Leaf324]|uniref:cupin domain-containing protein n=1 Tax=Aureimonas sp. Leaf324 TaxID=1736336 RepID=UPI000AAB1067|nr:cupin domain-containing protein [Aureimonas sp. Leaf324]